MQSFQDEGARDSVRLNMCPAGQLDLLGGADLSAALRLRFGIERFRPGQQEVIRALLDGRQVLAVMPTGAGKSLCYQLPALLVDGVTLVVSPLISLMQDQLAKLAALQIPAVRVDSSQSAEEQWRALRSIGSRDGPRLVFVAPERFRSARFVETMARAGVGLLAVDEAHCISQWGHDFRPDYARLGEVVRTLAPRRLLALTATATEAVRADIARVLGLDDPLVFVRGFDRANLDFSVERSGGDADKRARLARLLAEAGGPSLVYAATRKRAEQVARALDRPGRRAAAYHAGLPDEERAAVQRAFMAGELPVVVATTAFGMGVDKADVRLVVHHELPRSVESYYQEAGRGGRDGLPARCVLLFNHADVRLQEYLIDHAEAEEGIDPAVVEQRRAADRDRLRRMVAYAYAATCRRHFLLEYFGDPERRDRCDGCDLCRARVGPLPPLDEGQHLAVRKALSLVARVDGRFGRKKIALALAGSQAREVADAGLDRLPTFGALADRSLPFLMELLGALEGAGLLAATGSDYPTLSLTPAGREVMHDRARAAIRWPSDARSTPTVRARAEPDGDADPALVTRLRELRKRLADEARLPPYCIMHDSTLMELARRRPVDEAGLLTIKGIGASRAKRWGAQLLAALGGILAPSS